MLDSILGIVIAVAVCYSYIWTFKQGHNFGVKTGWYQGWNDRFDGKKDYDGRCEV